MATHSCRFAGPFLGLTFLIVVDAHSKWPQVIVMKTTTAARTIVVYYGLSNQLFSDNGPQFILAVFETFMTHNGIMHIHTATNGLAKRFHLFSQ